MVVLLLIVSAWCMSLMPVALEPGSATRSTAQDARRVINTFVDRKDLSPKEVNELIDFAEDLKGNLKGRLPLGDRIRRTFANPWVMFGFTAQATFMMRFVIQIIASERRKRSYVPVAFWYLSLVGGLMLLAYALERHDPVFVFGQGLGCGIYIRNLVLIRRRNTDYDNRMTERNDATAATGRSDAP